MSGTTQAAAWNSFVRSGMPPRPWMKPRGDLTEDKRFPFCRPDGLRALVERAGLASIDCTAIEIPTVFKDFADYWLPFTSGGGPAPGYCKSLAPDALQRLKGRLEATLPRQGDGSIALSARAWAVKARAA